MTLDDYLLLLGISTTAFARVTGVLSKQSIHHYRHGFRFPSPESMRIIEVHTGGAVTANDFVQQRVGPVLTLPVLGKRQIRGVVNKAATPVLGAANALPGRGPTKPRGGGSQSRGGSSSSGGVLPKPTKATKGGAAKAAQSRFAAGAV